MRQRILDPTTSASRALSQLHTKDSRKPAMDATPLRAAIGIALVALILALALRCDSKSAALPAPTIEQETPMYLTYDFHTHAGIELAALEQYLTSITTTTTPRSAAAPAAVPTASSAVDDRWDRLADCETGGNWAANTGNGYGGGLQFAHQPSWSTWRAFGGTEYAPNPWDASREQQIVVAERVLAVSGFGAWPGCSRKFGWL